jgi:SAM-dependent methyltransferase
MYSKQAAIYDSLYHFKDYAHESEYLLEVVRNRRPQARTLLETACGTGRFLQLLQPHFEVEGLDLSGEMLSIAAARVPNLPLHRGDMTAFDLHKQFDIVCCLFRSIAHVRTLEGLQAAIASMARHVSPGGLLVVDPFFTPTTFWDRHLVFNQYKGEDQQIAWMYVGKREGREVRLDMNFLVGTADEVEHFKEEVRLGLFTAEEMHAAFVAAGLSVEYDPVGPSKIGLYIGSKQG